MGRPGGASSAHAADRDERCGYGGDLGDAARSSRFPYVRYRYSDGQVELQEYIFLFRILVA
jgi:hypothetical protein